jgi:hypothetical protein
MIEDRLAPRLRASFVRSRSSSSGSFTEMIRIVHL